MDAIKSNYFDVNCLGREFNEQWNKEKYERRTMNTEFCFHLHTYIADGFKGNKEWSYI